MKKTISILSLLLFLSTPWFLPGCSREPSEPKVKAAVGQPAPDFVLTDLQGKDWKLSDLRGNVVFVNFWATWCPPCIQEMPSMERLNAKMEGRPFKMLAVLYRDRPEMAQSLINKTGYGFTVLIDADGSTAKQYGLTGVPETFIVDPNGILKEKFIGPYDWDSERAHQVIEQHMPQ
ncbi:MAG: TlpA disulfide reductase family protein [Desulfobulbaceae bacterium]